MRTHRRPQVRFRRRFRNFARDIWRRRRRGRSGARRWFVPTLSDLFHCLTSSLAALLCLASTSDSRRARCMSKSEKPSSFACCTSNPSPEPAIWPLREHGVEGGFLVEAMLGECSDDVDLFRLTGIARVTIMRNASIHLHDGCSGSAPSGRGSLHEPRDSDEAPAGRAETRLRLPSCREGPG